MSETTALTRTRGDGAALTTRSHVSTNGVENALLQGDLSRLSPQERLAYYEKVCESVGLNPLTRPFEYIRLNGKLTLYAKRDAAEQLRKINGVSITEMETDRMKGIYLVRAHAVDKDGRTDVATGAVPIGGASGDRLANAIMKAETKAKRRVTLSICGLGWLDETELETIDSAETVEVDPETGEIQEPREAAGEATKPGRDERPISKKQRKRLFAIAKNEGGYTNEGLKRLIDEYGYESTGDIKRYDYEEIVLDARSERLAAKYNRDPAVPDMFEAAEAETKAENATAEEGKEHPDYNVQIDRLRAELRAAYGDEGAWNEVIETWIERTADWPDRQKQRANQAVVDTKEACEKAAEEAKAENATRAAEAMQRGETALSPQQKGPKPLPEDVPMRSALVDAGLNTREAVQRAYQSGELQDVKGIGPKTEREIARALGLTDEVSIPTDDGSDLFE